jgi:chromosome segregation ATPase
LPTRYTATEIFLEGALMDSTETDLKARLVFFRDNIPTWARKASALKARVEEIRGASEIDEPEFLAIETSLGELHDETAAFNELVGEVSRISPAASAELAEAGDAFRLILLELTELSVALYSVRSGLNEIGDDIETPLDSPVESSVSRNATAP